MYTFFQPIKENRRRTTAKVKLCICLESKKIKNKIDNAAQGFLDISLFPNSLFHVENFVGDLIFV